MLPVSAMAPWMNSTLTKFMLGQACQLCHMAFCIH